MNCVRSFTSGNFYVLGFLCTNGAAPTKMAAFKYNIALRELLHPSLALRKHGSVFFTSMIIGFLHLGSRSISSGRVIFKASDFGAGKVPARLSLMQQLLQEAEEKAVYANEPTPKITLDHVNVNFARSGGPGGQNVNKVNTKVDMRFNVKGAYWLSDRVRERIMQLEKNRINKDGDIVISSTKTRTQKGNIEDALEKLQAIIDAASYVPPPPSEEQKKKIANLAAIEEQKRLQTKKALSQKKAIRKTRGSWD